MPKTGESDTGFFCFESAALRRWLNQLRMEGGAIGRATREFNFLPLIPLVASRGVVLTPRLIRLEETIGINCGQDAATVEVFLRSSHGC